MRLGVTPHYRYQLKVEVEPTERETITSALEDEPFELGEPLGLQKFGTRCASGLACERSEPHVPPAVRVSAENRALRKTRKACPAPDIVDGAVYN